MKKLLSWAVLATLLLGCNSQVNGQTTDDEAAQRKAQILENLKYQIPQLREATVVMGDLTESSDFPGIDQGSFTLNGQQSYSFLITRDNTKLVMLGSNVLDVSQSAEEIEAALAEERAAAAQEAEEVSNALDQVIAGLPMRGNPNAPVTIIEFSDFQCPYCARGYETVEQILAKHAEDVKFVYLHFPLPNHPWAEPAAIASICAAQQDADAFWTLHDNYFENQRQINPANVLDLSKTFLADAGIDLDTWAKCAGDPESAAYKGAASAVQGSIATGQQFGVSGTPGFFVNGQFINGAQPLETFDELIHEAKQAAQ